MWPFSKRKKEMVWMTLEQAQAMCTPSRACTLTGRNQYNGDASMGGYMDDTSLQTEQVGNAGHVEYWEAKPLPQEVPDMGRVQVNTHHKGAAGNQQELDRWHHLNADEWARVNVTEHEQVRR